MIDCKTLASGSTGNCVFFRVNDQHFLIDAGVSMKKLDLSLRQCDSSLKQIQGIFITHEHSDHTKALEMLVKHTQIPLYATFPTAREIYSSLKLKNKEEAAAAFQKQVRIITADNCYGVGDLNLQAFSVPHDSAECMGYLITDDSGNKLLGYAADMGHVTSTVAKALNGCKNLIVESNHDLQMLSESSYPAFLKERIHSDYGHLSNPDCAKFLCRMVSQGTKHITLFHLSRENNLPTLAYETNRSALTDAGAKLGEDFTLEVAPIEGITEVIR